MRKLNLFFILFGFCVMMIPSAWSGEDSHRSAVQAALNVKRDKSYRQRVSAVKQLPRILTESEGDALMQLLFLDPSADTTLTIEEFATVKNDIAGKLCADRRYTERLAADLVEMSDMETLGSTWNCYCIQYFSQVYPRASDSSKALISKTMDNALLRVDHPKSGTALIALANISEHCPEITSEYLSVRAWQLYTTDSVGVANKLTAFHVLGDLGDYRILRESRVILTDTSRNDPAHYRAASLAVLGKHGIAKDLSLIESYAKHADIRIRNAATHALKSMRKRLGNND